MRLPDEDEEDRVEIVHVFVTEVMVAQVGEVVEDSCAAELEAGAGAGAELEVERVDVDNGSG